jgi:hypothetical protein
VQIPCEFRQEFSFGRSRWRIPTLSGFQIPVIFLFYFMFFLTVLRGHGRNRKEPCQARIVNQMKFWFFVLVKTKRKKLERKAHNFSLPGAGTASLWIRTLIFSDDVSHWTVSFSYGFAGFYPLKRKCSCFGRILALKSKEVVLILCCGRFLGE